MGKQNNRISEGAAIELLKRLFGETEADLITLDEAYIAAGRGELDAETNRNWLNNVMTKLTQHNLIAPDYKYDGRKRLVGIKLTLTGRTALGRPTLRGDNFMPPKVGYVDVPRMEEPSYGDVAKAVRAFRDANPEYDVVFSVTLKDMPMVK